MGISNELRNAAMPLVKDLVKKFDRQIITWCVLRLGEQETIARQLDKEKKLKKIRDSLN